MKIKQRKIPHVFLHSVFFVLGFILVFSLIGVLLQSVLSSFPYATDALRTIGGIIIISMGILFLARTRYRIPFLGRSHRLAATRFRRFRNSYVSSLTFGMAFAVGWTPCVGFLEISLFGLVAASPASAFILLLAFSLGLGTPFLAAGLFASKLAKRLEKLPDILEYANIAGGLVLIFVGFLIVTNNLVLFLLVFFGSNYSVNTAG